MTTPDESIFTSDELLRIHGLVTRDWKEGDGPLPFSVVRNVIEMGRIHFENQKSMLEIEGPVYIVGDLHGDFAATYRIVNKARVQAEKRSFTDYKLLLLGDYVDRGRQSIRTIVFLVLQAFLYPKKVYMLRGNHETSSVNKIYGLWKECIKTYGEKQGKQLYEHINAMFWYIPLTCLVNEKILCMHGGIPTEINSLQDLRDIPRKLKKLTGIAVDLAWGDPLPGAQEDAVGKNPKQIPNTSRGLSNYSNAAAIDAFCDKLGVDIIIRGHQYCHKGVGSYANHRFITVFSCPDYEGQGNIGAMLFVGKDSVPSFIQIKPENYDENNNPDDDMTKDGDEPDDQLCEVTVPNNPPRGGKLPSTEQVSNLCLVAMCLMFCIAVVQSANLGTLDQFAAKSSILARYVNGLFIGQSLPSGIVKKEELINELFFLGPNVALDSLSTSNVTGLANVFKPLQTMIENECTGDIGCGVSNTILAGMNTIESLKQYVPILEDVLVATKTNGLDEISKLPDFFQKASSHNNLPSTLVEKFRIMETKKNEINDYASSLVDVYLAIDQLSILFKLLETGPELINQIENTDMEMVKSNLKLVSSIKNISTLFKTHHSSIETLNIELKAAEEKYQKLKSIFKDDMRQTANSKLDFLIDIKPLSTQEKKLTAGFFNGFKDIKDVMLDDQNDWLKDLLNSGSDLNVLSSKLGPLKNLSTEFESLHSSYEKVKFETGFHASNVKNSISTSFETITELHNLIQTYKKCIGELAIEFISTEDASGIEKIDIPSGDIAKLKGPIENLVTQHKDALNKIFQLGKTIKSNLGNLTAIEDVIQSGSMINETIDALNKFGSDLNSINFNRISFTLEDIKVSTVVNKIKNGIHRTKFIPAMHCLKDEDFIRKINKWNPYAKHLANNKADTIDMEAVIRLADSVGKLVEEWNKIKPSLGKTKRAAGFKLENAQEVSKNLGDFVSVVRRLDAMLKVESHLRNLIDGRKTIDTAVEGVSDPKEKERLKKLWNDNVVKSLENNLQIAKTVNEEVSKLKEIKNITDLKAPFLKAAEVQQSQIDIGELANALEGKINDQKLESSLKAVKLLNLNFATYQKTKIGGVLNDLQNFFDSIFADPSKKKNIDSCKNGTCSTVEATPEESELSWLDLILIIFGAVLLFTLLIAVIAGFIWREKVKKLWEQFKRRLNNKPTGEDDRVVAIEDEGIVYYVREKDKNHSPRIRRAIMNMESKETKREEKKLKPRKKRNSVAKSIKQKLRNKRQKRSKPPVATLSHNEEIERKLLEEETQLRKLIRVLSAPSQMVLLNWIAPWIFSMSTVPDTRVYADKRVNPVDYFKSGRHVEDNRLFHISDEQVLICESTREEFERPIESSTRTGRSEGLRTARERDSSTRSATMRTAREASTRGSAGTDNQGEYDSGTESGWETGWETEDEYQRTICPPDEDDEIPDPPPLTDEEIDLGKVDLNAIAPKISNSNGS